MSQRPGQRHDALPRGAAFHEKLADQWSDGYARKSFRKRRSAIVGCLEDHVQPGEHWLDLGCGSGVLSTELLKLGADVTAIDGSPSMLDAARAALPETSPITLLQSDVTRLASLSDASFNGVLCSSVIEYVDTPEDLLAEAARVLRPGGQLILSVPATWSILRSTQKVARRFFALLGKSKFSYLDVSRLEIDPTSAPDWLGKHGFKVQHIIGFDPLLGKGWGPFRPALLIIDARKDTK